MIEAEIRYLHTQWFEILSYSADRYEKLFFDSYKLKIIFYYNDDNSNRDKNYNIFENVPINSIILIQINSSNDSLKIRLNVIFFLFFILKISH